MRKPSKAKTAKKTVPASGRSVWTGQLRLALVSIPVQLVSAVQAGARLAFHQIDQKSKKRIRYEKVAPGIGKVEPANIVKGFEVSKGEYVFVTDEDLDKVKIEARRTVDLVQFVDHCEIDPIYFEKPYYVIRMGIWLRKPMAFCAMRCGLRARWAGAVRDARARICRGAEALRPGNDAGDIAVCR